MREVAVIGTDMTRFGKYIDKGIKSLVYASVKGAMADAGVEKKNIQAAFMANAVGGLMTGQEMIRGQVTLSAMGIDSIPIYNVESACASSSSAFNLAYMAVAGGMYDCVLVTGYEKLYDVDKQKSFNALGTAFDIENGIEFFKEAEKHFKTGEKIFKEGAGEKRSIFMDMYAFLIKGYMDRYGLTQQHFAKLAVKSHKNGALNPHAQYQKEVSTEEVLNSGDVVFPLTRMMCSPVCDGSAAAILCAKSEVAKYTTHPVWVAASVAGSGKLTYDKEDSITKRLAPQVYKMAGVGPKDIDMVEIHDATSPCEIMFLIELGLCPGEEAGHWIDNGAFDLDGRMPSNSSGGLATKGHPIAATGCGQIYEIVTQLRQRAGKRQVPNHPKIGMTHNGGGILGIDAASMTLHIFKR
ncbi:MAG: thiolase family protein [Desulfobacterales bacterium]|nr:thiolase family protein [Desulfobacterales bacterium]